MPHKVQIQQYHYKTVHCNTPPEEA